MFQFLKENKGFSVVLLLAILVRFLPFFHYQFSYDELSALSRTTYASWHDLLQYGAQIDAHPVLIQCFLFAWVKLVGYSEAWIKLPFLCFSIGSIVYAYLFSLKWFGKTPALLSAVIFSFSFIFVYYSPLARMYASGLFFSTAFMYYWFTVLFDEARTTKHFVWMAVFILLSALNSHIGCLFVLLCGLTGLLYTRKQDGLRYILFCAATVVLYLPHLSVTLFQLDYGGIGASQDGWLAAPDKLVLFSLMKTLLGTGYTWVAFVAGALVSVMMSKQRLNKKAGLLLTLFFLNYAIIHLYSVLKAPVFQYSVMLFSAPCFVWGATSLFGSESKWMKGVVSAMAFLLCFQTFYVKDFYRNCVRNQNAVQYKTLKSLENKYGREAVTAVFFDTEKLFMLLYEVRDKHKLSYYLGTDTSISNTAQFRRLLVNSPADYLLLGNASPERVEMCKAMFPYFSYGIQNANLNLCVLSRKKQDETTGRFFKVVDSAGYFNRGHYEFNVNNDLAAPSNGEVNFRVDSLNEFPFMVKADLKANSSKEGQVILAIATITSSEALRDVGLQFSVSDPKDSTLFFGGTALAPFYTAEPGGYKVVTQLFLGSEYKRWRKGSVKCFFWNRSRQKFSIKAFKIETVDYWPLKWALWE